jgi:N-acetylmuramoyl-L-alanine amidase
VRIACAVALAASASILSFLPIGAQERPAAAEPATFMAQLDVDGVREPLPATLGTAGPLFLLQPIVARLGASLDVVPLERSYRLRIAETDVVLGPSTQAMTVGRSIVTLRQVPFTSGAGLWVPFEALEQSFGELLGLDLRWFPDERVLEIKSRHAREVALDVQVVHIQGVTTVVLQFDRAAKYQVASRGPVVDVTIPLDRVRLLRDPKPPRQSLLDRVETSEHLVRLVLASGAAAADPYVLPAGAGQNAGGLRLVIDISSSAAPPLTVDGGATLPDVDPSFETPGLRTIVLDPGHGGVERGAIGPAGTEEKELTLILAKALKRKLEERLAVQVVLTRNEDADLPLDTRTALANQTKGDLFISIHLNASPESSAHGAETYFLSPRATDARALQVAESENRGAAGVNADGGTADAGLQLLLWDLAQSQHLAASQSLAQLIQQELNTTLGLTDRGVRQAPFAVLVGATMPAVLVELGFITNSKEEERLLDPAYRADLLDAVVRAVVRFKSMVDGGTESAAVVRPAPPPPGTGQE